MFAEGMIVDFLVSVSMILAVVYTVQKSKTRTWPIRKIAGLEAIDEAIGRATETDRMVLYLPGYGGLSDPQTLASLGVLSEVGKSTARYDCRLTVAVEYANLVPVFEEVVRTSYLAAGKADGFKPEEIRWFSDHYYGYAIAVIGMIYKERPASMILMGNFAFDALMYAEAGAQVGAIQIGGTANTGQIPFFVAACDYALIGEEIFAAAAYLTQEPARIATIVVEDWGKFIVTGLVLLGSILATSNAVDWLNELLGS
ncbi:MAG TPA: hypothetical protein GX529_07775 [Firmicutes bacterium]|nr:hypothetical protein [Candidatus Fermentithermobacillaceae bacterium]